MGVQHVQRNRRESMENLVISMARGVARLKSKAGPCCKSVVCHMLKTPRGFDLHKPLKGGVA
jgi:hypothetical protein